MSKDRFFREFVLTIARVLKIDMFVSTDKGLSVNINQSEFLNGVYEDYLESVKKRGFKTVWRKKF